MCISTELKASGIFVDVDNMVLGQQADQFDIGRVMARVRQESPPLLRRAYGDWGRFAQLRPDFTREAFDLVQVGAGKNGVDIQLAVDALEAIFFLPHIGTIYLVTGDSDYCALARVLRRHRRRVVGISWLDALAKNFREHCDEFWPYDELTGNGTPAQQWVRSERVRGLIRQAAALLGPGEWVKLSKLKIILLDLDPTFDEKKQGFAQFKDFVEAQPDLVLRFSDVIGEYEARLPADDRIARNGSGGV